MLAEAEAIDVAEDEDFGADRRGDEVPAELATKEGRLAKLRAAKEAIEAEAKERAAPKASKRPKSEGPASKRPSRRGRGGREGDTAGRAQRNFTDPESRMMKTTDGFHYA